MSFMSGFHCFALHLYMCTEHRGDRQCIVVADKETLRLNNCYSSDIKDWKGPLFASMDSGLEA